MGILAYNEIVTRKLIELDGDVYEVLDYQVSRKQQNKPVNRTKLRSLTTGKVVEYTFHMSDKVKEADVDRRPMRFEFVNRKKGEVWFCDPLNPKDRVSMTLEEVGDEIFFVAPRSELKLLVYNDGGNERIIGVDYPVTSELKVVSAPPAVKGDTATGGSKVVELETGVELSVPLFIKEGDVVKVNVSKKSYIERV